MDAVESRVLAPAKVNLSLRITGRRADGYHLIDSVMAPVGLYDELVIRIGPPANGKEPTVQVTSDSPHAPGGPGNLAFKAAELLLSMLPQRSSRIDIEIRKRIPVGSGLGGGSSDAAAVLVRLNQILAVSRSLAELATLGARLGADVPFFVHGRPARVTGIGDVVCPLAIPEPLSLVVCSDGRTLATRDVYAGVDLALTSGHLGSNIATFVSGGKPLSALVVNDLEAAAARLHPGVLSLKARLMRHGARSALMTGSGAAVFGIWPDFESAKHAAGRLRECGLWAEAAQTLAASPVVAE
jgi:4-diphosphocytidyl-2-C-methyl-D-erythritol kinase